MLKADTDLAVAGEVANFAETLELIDGLKPDIVALDLHMPDERILLAGKCEAASARKCGLYFSSLLSKLAENWSPISPE